MPVPAKWRDVNDKAGHLLAAAVEADGNEPFAVLE
jgi:hypothetical protein